MTVVRCSDALPMARSVATTLAITVHSPLTEYAVCLTWPHLHLRTAPFTVQCTDKTSQQSTDTPVLVAFHYFWLIK